MSYEKYAREISREFIRNHEESERIIKFLFDRIGHDLARGKRVYFRGFGSFKKVEMLARKYRNRKTKKIETRPPYKDIEFKTSKPLLEKLR